jgi:glycosyltransferase involved in cell wall biosynthesis
LKIRQPIFIVGCGRSGSTLLYNLMAGHKDLTWFSNYTDKYPNQPWISKFNYLFKDPTISKNFRDNQLFPFIIPSEAHDLWNLFHPLEQGGDPPLFESDVKDANVVLMKKTILNHLKYSKCRRFVNKNTRNTHRSLYPYKIFPDALFIHIIRDGRAVTNSLLNVDFWRNLHLWYRDDFKTPTQLIQEGENEILLAAKLWKFEVQRMLLHSKKIETIYKVEKKIHVIPNGVDPLAFYPKNNEEDVPTRLLKKTHPRILSVGRLDVIKNIPFLLRSFSFLLEDFPNASLIICGDGPMKNHAYVMARELGIGDKVLFTGLFTRSYPRIIETAIFSP